jgi:hypothetical protein
MMAKLIVVVVPNPHIPHKKRWVRKPRTTEQYSAIPQESLGKKLCAGWQKSNSDDNFN